MTFTFFRCASCSVYCLHRQNIYERGQAGSICSRLRRVQLHGVPSGQPCNRQPTAHQAVDRRRTGSEYFALLYGGFPFIGRNHRRAESQHDAGQPASRRSDAPYQTERVRHERCAADRRHRAFTEILGNAWEDKKKMAASITNPQIEKVFRVALEAGATTGKVSGAGGGGFIMFAVEPTKRVQVVRALNRLEGRVVEFQFTEGGTHGWKIFTK